jgi:hypothetical protein
VDDCVGPTQWLVEIICADVAAMPFEAGIVIWRGAFAGWSPGESDDAVDSWRAQQCGDERTTDVAGGAGHHHAHVSSPSSQSRVAGPLAIGVLALVRIEVLAAATGFALFARGQPFVQPLGFLLALFFHELIGELGVPINVPPEPVGGAAVSTEGCPAGVTHFHSSRRR